MSGASHLVPACTTHCCPTRHSPVQGIPKLAAFRPYLGVASTLLARTLFTMCSYTCITAAATSLGTPQAAAHQVTLQLFWFLSCKLATHAGPAAIAMQCVLIAGAPMLQSAVAAALL